MISLAHFNSLTQIFRHFRYNNRKKKGGERFAALMENTLNVVTFKDVKVVKYAA